jgi:hypothetical protein
VIYEGTGSASGGGIVWNTTWVATAGIHNVEALFTVIIEIKPDWSKEAFAPGYSWSHGICQIRVE